MKWCQGPANGIYTAPEGTLAPEISLTPPNTWSLLGTNGARSISDDGLSVTIEETIESQRSLGSTGVQKLFRTEEDVMLGISLLDVTVETFSIAMSGLPVTQVPPAAGGGASPAFTATPVATVDGGTGTGATVATMTVDGSGNITAVTWTSGGLGYVAGDVITFRQGTVFGTYTVLSGDVAGAGILQNLSGISISPQARPGAAGYRHVSLLRGFNVLNLAFLARGFSPYADDMFAQYWLPKAYASFSGELQYTKGEAAAIEVEIMAIEHLTHGYGQYQAQYAVAP